MKRLLLFATVISLFLFGCSIGKLDSYIEISYKDHEKRLENKEDFILFIGSDTCSACSTYKETIKPIIKEYQVKIYYIDLDKLSESERNHFNTHYNFSSTPTTVFVTGGEEKSTYNRINKAETREKIIEILKRNNYIEG